MIVADVEHVPKPCLRASVPQISSNACGDGVCAAQRKVVVDHGALDMINKTIHSSSFLKKTDSGNDITCW